MALTDLQKTMIMGQLQRAASQQTIASNSVPLESIAQDIGGHLEDDKPKRGRKSKKVHKVLSYIVGEQCKIAMESGAVQFARGAVIEDMGTVRELRQAGITMHPVFSDELVEVENDDESAETAPTNEVEESDLPEDAAPQAASLDKSADTPSKACASGESFCTHDGCEELNALNSENCSKH